MSTLKTISKRKQSKLNAWLNQDSVSKNEIKASNVNIGNRFFFDYEASGKKFKKSC